MMSVSPCWRMAEDHRVYAVGDIHGRSDLLEDLLKKIAADRAQSPPLAHDVLVFIGDYVDRGPDCRGVIDILLAGLPLEFAPVFLKGNHEDFLLEFLNTPAVLPLWRANGCEETLRSYGVTCQDSAEFCQRDFRDALPASHRRFFQELRTYAIFGDYYFAHAGVDPTRPLSRTIGQGPAMGAPSVSKLQRCSGKVCRSWAHTKRDAGI